jgi:hypothetical protein
MITLGKDQGGYLGQLLGGRGGRRDRRHGLAPARLLLMLVGSLLLSGASLGAILRRSGRAATSRARRRGAAGR